MPLLADSLSSDDFKCRFWAKISVRGDDECWPWLAAINAKGYGVIGLHRSRRTALATHVMLELSGHPRVDGLHALHRCDNPACLNPRHLRWGTNAENVSEMMERARHRCNPAKGERQHKAKLTADMVRQIRLSDAPGVELARAMNVSPQAINHVRSGRTWRHVQ